MPRFATAAASFRKATEDRVLVFRAGERWIACVADGTSGASGAARAAERFVAGVRRAVDSRAVDVSDSSAWVSLLAALDREIHRDPGAGETTGIALAVTPAAIVGASVGDSRAWLFGQTALELTGGQARKRRLGSGRAIPRGFGAPARGTLVVATDGLFDHAAIAAIAAIARAGAPDAADALARLPGASARALPDDVAVVVGWLDAGDAP